MPQNCRFLGVTTEGLFVLIVRKEGPAQRARSARELALSCLLKEGVADFKCGARVAVFFQSFRDPLWLRLLVFSFGLK